MILQELIDKLGFDPRSTYVETYWLGVLGPSTTWLLRRLVAGLDDAPDGYPMPLSETARSLGLGDRGGRHSPFIRAITRTIQFELANPEGDAALAVRRKVPPLNRRQLQRLPPSLQAAHGRWQDEQLRVHGLLATRSFGNTDFEAARPSGLSSGDLRQ